MKFSERSVFVEKKKTEYVKEERRGLKKKKNYLGFR